MLYIYIVVYIIVVYIYIFLPCMDVNQLKEISKPAALSGGSAPPRQAVCCSHQCTPSIRFTSLLDHLLILWSAADWLEGVQ